ADPGDTDDPEKVRVIVARLAVTAAVSGDLIPDDLVALLEGVPSLRDPGQWLDPFGAIRWIVPAAIAGHQVALDAPARIAARPDQVGANGRKEIRFALQSAIGEHPDLIPQALAICFGWHIAKPFTEACRTYRQPFKSYLANYHVQLDQLIDDLIGLGGE